MVDKEVREGPIALHFLVGVQSNWYLMSQGLIIIFKLSISVIIFIAADLLARHPILFLLSG